MSQHLPLVLALAVAFFVLYLIQQARQSRNKGSEENGSAPGAAPLDAAVPKTRDGAAGDADQAASGAAASSLAPTPDVPAPYALDTALLALAQSGGGTRRGGKEMHFSAREIGLLEISTGKVAASDPLVQPDPPGFTQAVPNGRHPVRVLIAAFGSDERIAYAQLRFSDAAPVRWEMAHVGTQANEPLGEGQFFGYGVDAGIGCFMDPRAGELLAERMGVEDDYFEVIIDDMEKTYAHTRSWLDFRPNPRAAENVICFSSGWGDGVYPSFFGFDAEGGVAQLVTDFLVVGEAE
jgi:hypothetical protein